MSPRDVYLLTVSATPLIAALVVLCWVASLVRRRLGGPLFQPTDPP